MKNVVVALLLVLLAVPAQANEVILFPAIEESDAVEERLGEYRGFPVGGIDFESSDLEIVDEDPNDPASRQIIGLRFPSVEIDKDTVILDAYIQFTVDETKGSGTNLVATIAGIADVNPGPFTTENRNVSKRDTTNTTVIWNDAPDWEAAGDQGLAQQTPDIKAIVQEIVAKDGWAAGNAMGFVIKGTGGTRTAEAIRTGSNAQFNPTLVIVTPTTTAFPVISGADDVEESVADGSKSFGSSDLELVEDGGPEDQQRIGLRFQNILIEPGATILEARVRFDVDETDIPSDNRNPFTVTITGEDTDDSEAFDATTTFDVRDRVTGGNGTDATVTWTLGVEGDPEFWTVVHSKQFTPDLSPIIQEIIDREGWEGGNALTLVLGSETDTGERVAESFDGAGSNLDRRPTLIITFDGDAAPPPAPTTTDKYRIMWNDDPATTMAIAWNQILGENPVVKWGLKSGITDPDDPEDPGYTNETAPERSVEKLTMVTKHVKLSGLTPDTDYQFIIVDSLNQSRSMWFKTAPNVQQPIAYISGGDTKSSGSALTAGQITNGMVPLLRPLFVFFTGDFVSGDGTSAGQWVQWLNDWSEKTVADDGQMFPLLANHGNHEDGDFAVLYDLFNTPLTSNFGSTFSIGDGEALDIYCLSFADKLLKVYSLNSQLYQLPGDDAFEAQEAWLEQDLAAASLDHTFTIAGYHKPTRPHTSGKRENFDRTGDLAKLFEQYGLDIVADGDSHMNRITFPVVTCDDTDPECFQNFKRDDDLGTLYIGEGSWGASPRSSDDDKPWTIKSGSFNQLKWVFVYPDNPETPEDESLMEIRTVKTVESGANLTQGVVGNPAGDSFSIPANLQLENYGPLGNIVTVPFEAPVGDVPAAPTGFAGIATGFNDVELSWSGVDPADVTRLEIQQLIGDEWVQVSTNITPEQTTFAIGNLPDNTTFTYRLRSINFFGESEFVEASVTTENDPRLIGRFQQGVNGYDSCLDTEIREETKDTGFPSIGDTVSVDRNENGRGDARWVLIKFEDIFGDPKDGLIPEGATILQANLSFDVTSSTGGGTVYFTRMPVEWVRETSWNDVVDFGLPIEDGTIVEGIFNAGTEDASFVGASSGQIKTVDVTSSLKAWVADPSSNQGWLITSSSGDGWDWVQASGGTPSERPLLEVFYELKGDQDNDGDLDRKDLFALRSFLNRPADEANCPGCDMDENGIINILDFRRMIIECTRFRCAE